MKVLLLVRERRVGEGGGEERGEKKGESEKRGGERRRKGREKRRKRKKEERRGKEEGREEGREREREIESKQVSDGMHIAFTVSVIHLLHSPNLAGDVLCSPGDLEHCFLDCRPASLQGQVSQTKPQQFYLHALKMGFSGIK